MEAAEKDDDQDIFQECNSTDATRKSEHGQQHYNNHYVVPVGMIIVLMTICLGMTSVQKCQVIGVSNTDIKAKVQQHKELIFNYLQKSEKLENSQILERLLEYEGICKDLEIFTKNVEQHQKEEEDEKEEEENNDVDVLKHIDKESEVKDGDESSGSGRGCASGNGVCTRTSRHKNKKSKYSIKTTNTKTGFNKYNKSTKVKYQKIHKKELNLNQKNSTAEPIIYLFALVFIYLLLKAASDINQHYKSQNKNDKRLRRCSLQSYAQTHRPDRRASKELALKQKQKLQLQQQQQQRLKTLSRSPSQDQQNYPYTSHQKQSQQHFMDGQPPQESDKQQLITTPNSPIRSKNAYSSNWQLLKQHTTTQSLDNSDIINCARGNADRRCSVPAALGYQRRRLSSASPLSIANDHVNVCLSRRPSITSPLLLPVDSNDSLLTEPKRRVRMINRH